MKIQILVLSCFCLLLSVSSSAWSIDANCHSPNWRPIGDDGVFFEGAGCRNIEDRALHFKALAFSLPNVELGLIGAGQSSKPPTLSEAVEARKSGVVDKGYFLSATHKRHPKIKVMTPIGYPEWAPQKSAKEVDEDWLHEQVNEKWLLQTGLIRISGRTISNPDLSAKFKSAYLCLDETSKNTVSGSRLVVFNAFEEGFAVEMNSRLLDPNNCKDVVQTGPRIVEYRAKPGIIDSNSRQRWLVLAQGNGSSSSNGRSYLGYLIFFENKVSLKDVERLLLDKNLFSQYDNQMRVAVVLTSNNFSNVSVMTERGLPVLWAKDRPHPLYLTIKTLN